MIRHLPYFMLACAILAVLVLLDYIRALNGG